MSANNNNTVSQAASAVDAATSVMQKFDTSKGTASRQMARDDRTSWRIFDPSKVTAVFDKNEAKIVWMGDDGKPDMNATVEIEPPPLLMKRSSQIVGEGDAFKVVIEDGKELKLSRARAHFRATFRADVTPETAAKFPEWHAMQLAFFEKIEAAEMNALRETLKWKHSDAWRGYIEQAEGLAFAKVSGMLTKEQQQLNDLQQMQIIKASPALFAEFEQKQWEAYVKGARYAGKPLYTKAGVLLPKTVSVESKVYATQDFDTGAYDRDNKGPDESKCKSNNNDLATAIKLMATMPGKGGVGVDVRTYQPVRFVNDNYDKHEKGHIMERPNIKLADGRIVPDYWYNPACFRKGKKMQAYCTLVIQPVATASAKGGYGIKHYWKNRKTLKVIRREEIAEREMERYAGKRDSDDRSDDESDSEQIQQDSKRRSMQEDGGSYAVDTSTAVTPTTGTSSAVAVTTVPATGAPADTPLEDLYGF